MDLKQLQYFVFSVDCGSFKKASELLYISQPNISKTIKSLENELQMELLKRQARGVEVTEDGKKVYEYACRILAEAGKIRSIPTEQRIKRLRVVSHPSERMSALFCDFFAGELEAELHGEYRECGTQEILQSLHHHTADIGLLCVSQRHWLMFQQMLEYRKLEFIEAGSTVPVLFAGPGSSLYHEKYVTLSKIRDIRLVQMRMDGEEMNEDLIWENKALSYYQKNRQVLLTNSRSLVNQMLEHTVLCNVSSALFPEPGKSEWIHEIPIQGAEEHFVFGYVKRKRDLLSEEAEKFMKYVKVHV